MDEAVSQASTVATLTVTEAEHFRFAAFSGDRNPMHTDAVFARRTLPGAIAAYGMHLLLWALDALAAHGVIDANLGRIRARFVRWVYLGDTVRLVTSNTLTTSPKRMELFVDEVPVVVIDFSYASGDPSTPEHLHSKAPHARRPTAVERVIEALEGVHGTVAPCEMQKAAELFPALARVFGPALAAEIASVSYVIGMEAPGLHSIDSRADWLLQTPVGANACDFRYCVTSVEERFRLARIAVQGLAISGTVEALVRRPPVTQLSLHNARQHVREDEFRRMSALVIGASRGVGETTAKLLLAGGASVIATYAQGAHEAQSLCENALRTDLPLRIAHLNAVAPEICLPAAPNGSYTHLFYFASGPMFQRRTRADAQRLTEEMHGIYVDGFSRVLAALLAQQAEAPLAVFYPSTVLIETEPGTHPELIHAKLAGEAMCADWNAQHSGVTVISERLPRMRTDQTASVLPQHNADAADIMLPILRRLAAL